MNKVNYTGNFLHWFLYNLLWSLVTIITFGIFLPYQIYWNQKYFFSHLEVAK